MVYSLLLLIIQGKTLSLQQKTWKSYINRGKIPWKSYICMIKRKIDTVIEEHFRSSRKALFLTGARQSGKTYAIR